MTTPRLLAALLLASLAGNAALLLRAPRAPAPSAGSAARPTSPAHPAPARSAATVSPEAALAVGDALEARDPAAFRDLLVAAGIEPKLRKQLLLTLLQHRYEDRFRAIQPDNADRLLAEWWRNPDDRESYSGPANLERQRASQKVQDEFMAELGRLTGEDPKTLDLEDNPWLARQYAGLPREKAEALHRLDLDYQELEQEIHSRSMEFQLPADIEKLRLLRSERERDIAALLTPEERAAWELRASPTAERVRGHATELKATEDEYRRIYALQKTFDDAFETDDPGPRAEPDWKAREEAQKALDAGIRAIVGEERFAAAKREQDQDFYLARAAAERLSLPADTAGRLYDLRRPAAAESQRIAADPKLGLAEKRAALAKLAADTRATVERALGAEAADAYFERGGMRWLEDVAKGGQLLLTPDGPETKPLDAPDDASPPVVRVE